MSCKSLRQSRTLQLFQKALDGSGNGGNTGAQGGGGGCATWVNGAGIVGFIFNWNKSNDDIV